MSHTFVNALFHCVFSTKGRRPLIVPSLQQRLWPFLGGIARESGMKAVAIGGVEDHAHLLLAAGDASIAKGIQLIEGGGCVALGPRHVSRHRDFAWQEGYGAFSIGVSQTEESTQYIHTQAEHHRKRTFQEEFRAFLKRHGFEYDEQRVWG